MGQMDSYCPLLRVFMTTLKKRKQHTPEHKLLYIKKKEDIIFTSINVCFVFLFFVI